MDRAKAHNAAASINVRRAKGFCAGTEKQRNRGVNRGAWTSLCGAVLCWAEQDLLFPTRKTTTASVRSSIHAIVRPFSPLIVRFLVSLRLKRSAGLKWPLLSLHPLLVGYETRIDSKHCIGCHIYIFTSLWWHSLWWITLHALSCMIDIWMKSLSIVETKFTRILLAFSVGQRLCIDFFVSRENFLTTLRSQLDVTCSYYYWSKIFNADIKYIYIYSWLQLFFVCMIYMPSQ